MGNARNLDKTYKEEGLSQASNVSKNVQYGVNSPLIEVVVLIYPNEDLDSWLVICNAFLCVLPVFVYSLKAELIICSQGEDLIF